MFPPHGLWPPLLMSGCTPWPHVWWAVVKKATELPPDLPQCWHGVAGAQLSGIFLTLHYALRGADVFSQIPGAISR